MHYGMTRRNPVHRNHPGQHSVDELAQRYRAQGISTKDRRYVIDGFHPGQRVWFKGGRGPGVVIYQMLPFDGRFHGEPGAYVDDHGNIRPAALSSLVTSSPRARTRGSRARSNPYRQRRPSHPEFMEYEEYEEEGDDLGESMSMLAAYELNPQAARTYSMHRADIAKCAAGPHESCEPGAHGRFARTLYVGADGRVYFPGQTDQTRSPLKHGRSVGGEPVVNIGNWPYWKQFSKTAIRAKRHKRARGDDRGPRPADMAPGFAAAVGRGRREAHERARGGWANNPWGRRGYQGFHANPYRPRRSSRPDYLEYEEYEEEGDDLGESMSALEAYELNPRACARCGMVNCPCGCQGDPSRCSCPGRAYQHNPRMALSFDHQEKFSRIMCGTAIQLRRKLMHALNIMNTAQRTKFFRGE